MNRYQRISIAIRPEHTNPNEVVHGGLVTALLDEAMAGALAAERGLEATRAAPHASVEQNVSFLAAARPGDEVVVEGRVLRLGRTAAFAEGEATRRGDGALIAKTRGVFLIQRGGY